MPTLSDKLKSLGVKIGARDLPSTQKARDLRPPRPPASNSIQDAVPGRLHSTAHGDTFIVESNYADDYRHGTVALAQNASFKIIAEWLRDQRFAECDLSRIVFLDTETTGLAGGTGTMAFLVGIGRYEGNAFRVTQFFVRDPIEERAMLAALGDWLNPLDALVTFNGKSFDIPLLTTRYITHRATKPFSAALHLDLLPLARRLWRERLESRALGSLETHILGAARTGEDVPGWQIPQLYFDYLRYGDARPLKNVFYHNAMDVLAMAALLKHIAQMLSDPLRFADNQMVDLVAIGKLFEDMGRLDAAASLYRRALEQDSSEQIFGETLRRLSFLERRRGEIASAVELWSAAAQSKQLYAFIELAKHFEHRARDYDQAIHWTQSALTILRDLNFSSVEQARWRKELEHRFARLESKSK